MNKEMPLLSIGLPVYNSSEYLTEVLDSLINQTFRDFELIISDDASNDKTVNICKSYAQKDDRICFISQKTNIGMVSNQNFVLNHSHGKYFMWAAHDDFYHIDFVQTLINRLEQNKDLVTAFCQVAIFTDTTTKIETTYKINFSSRFRINRMISFCLDFNDAVFYGIHRRQILAGTKVPTWWGKNSVTPANSNYPVVFYLLACGRYELVGDIPLFFKRKKVASYPLNPYNQGLAPYWYLIVRKFNLFVECIKYIYSGSHSVLLTTSMLLPVFVRITKDTVIDIYYRIKCSILRRKM